MIPILLISENHKLVNQFVKKLIDKNSYLFEIKPENKEFSIKEIRSIKKEVASFHKEKRIYLLENFNLSSLDAQNAFLKLLEEPPVNTQFVLTSINEESLLPTILSRVKIHRLENKNDTKIQSETLDKLNHLIKNKKINFLTGEQLTLDEIILFFRSRLKTDKNAPIIIKEALKTKSLVANNNINSVLAFDHILIFIFKIYKMN